MKKETFTKRFKVFIQKIRRQGLELAELEGNNHLGNIDFLIDSLYQIYEEGIIMTDDIISQKIYEELIRFDTDKSNWEFFPENRFLMFLALIKMLNIVDKKYWQHHMPVLAILNQLKIHVGLGIDREKKEKIIKYIMEEKLIHYKMIHLVISILKIDLWGG